MSAKSMFRVASPRALRSPSSPRSILKRPPPLAISQNPPPFAAAPSVVHPGSSRVHFPPSPGLTATFSTHSPNSYDRGAIKISPNPLELPPWGSHVYSPGSHTFSTLSPAESGSSEELTPKFKTFTPLLASPNTELFPKSPGVEKPTTRAGARFQAIASKPSIQSVSTLGDALKAYPRSPYPSAPAPPSPAVLADKENNELDNGLTGKVWSRTKTVYGNNPARASRQFAGKGRKVPPAIQVIGRPAEMISSPLRQQFMSPLNDSSQRTATVANSSLTQAFWQSMSLDESVDIEDTGAPGFLSPGGMISPMIFGTKEGVVWSPSRQNEDAATRMRTLKRNLMTLGKPAAPPAMVMSPSPEDPFSAFPTFAAVLSLDHETEGSIITYPPRVVTVESAAKKRR